MVDAKKLTVRNVEAFVGARRGSGEHFLWDSEIKGLGLRVRGARATYVLQYRVPNPPRGLKTRRFKIGDHPVLKPEQARIKAHKLLGKVGDGEDPAAERVAHRRAHAPKNSINAVVDDFIERYAKRHNRSWKETKRIFDVYVLPQWGGRQTTEIGRLDVSKLLDKVEDENGPVMADRVLAAIRKLFNWHATRDDKFISPVVKGMARTKPKKRARTRLLSDDEIRVIWRASAQMETYGAIVRALFLLAQRRGEVTEMVRPELAGSDWTIAAVRYKTGLDHVVPLPRQALDIIEDQAVYEDCDYVFTTDGESPFQGFAKAKRRLDALILEDLRTQAAKRGETAEKVAPLPHWTLHDIRRTAKTLMQRAGVRPDISERVLGHVIPGVEGTYDRYVYLEEKRDALKRLAALLDQILTSADAKVIPMRPAAPAA